MALLSQDELIKIRSNVNIVDIISSYIPLTQRGKNYFGVCPFHDDHSPSMSVSFEKQMYKCFSCGAGGNVFTFVQEYENITFLEAVKKIAEKSGISISQIDTSSKTINKIELEIMDVSNKFYQNNLKTSVGSIARKYLEQRGITEEIISEFDIGLSLDEKDTLAKLLISKKYLEDKIINLGLINKNDISMYDIFTKRIMFPIHDVNGKVIAFTGRIYKSEDNSKYINSRESIIFKKGHILYNYHNAKDEARRKKEIIVVEGNMDAIRLSSVGIKNVVALMGTSLTKEQVELLKKLRVRVILCLDNDDAGRKAADVNGEMLTNANIETYVINLSDAKDPDEYIIKKGVQAFNENLKNPHKYYDFKINYLKEDKNLNKADELAAYVNEVINSLNNTTDDILKEITINKLSEEYNLSVDLLKNKLKKNVKKEEVIPKITVHKKQNKYDISAQKILYFMMNDPKYIRIYKKHLGYFDNKLYRNLANEIQYYQSINQDITIADFLSYISQKDELNTLVMDIIKTSDEKELDDNIYEDYIATIKSEIHLNEIKEIKKEIKEEMDENKKMELLKRLREIKKEV